jgi:hypothetical protein
MDLNGLWKQDKSPAVAAAHTMPPRENKPATPGRHDITRAKQTLPARQAAPAAPVKPVFRLEENSNLFQARGLEIDTYILFGPHADDGLPEALEDDNIRSVVIAKRAALLTPLPTNIKTCTLMCRYPTGRVGGLSASDPGSIQAWGNYISNKLGVKLSEKGIKPPVLLFAPDKSREQIALCFLWTPGLTVVSGRDVQRFAAILEQLLWHE